IFSWSAIPPQCMFRASADQVLGQFMVNKGNDSSPKAATVVLNWNGWADTIECLRSLSALDYPSHAIFVVDNGSTDDSLERIQEAFPSVELIPNYENLGFAGGCNVGIAKALEWGAKYIWLLNNDAIADPHALSAMVNVAEFDPGVGAVGSIIYDFHKPQEIQAWGGGRVDFWLGRVRHIVTAVPSSYIHYITGTSLLIRDEALRQVGGLDNSFFMYWEDADLSFRLRKAGWRLAVAPQSKVWHKESQSAGKGSRRDSLLTCSQIRFVARHAPFPLYTNIVGIAGKLAKSALKTDWRRIRSIYIGVLDGTGFGLR